MQAWHKGKKNAGSAAPNLHSSYYFKFLSAGGRGVELH
jgi:hypothetical protein